MSRIGVTRPAFRVFAFLAIAFTLALVAAPSARADGALVTIDTLPGPIFDVQPDRILFGTCSDSCNNGATGVAIKDRSTGQITTITGFAPNLPRFGYLTSHGAIFEAGGPTFDVYEWRDGSLLHLDTDSTGTLRVKGNYAIWHSASPNTGTLNRRDLSLGVTNVVSTNAGGGDVAANGDVVWSDRSNYQIYRYRNGTTTKLTNDDLAQSYQNRDPRTDGTNVVYVKEPWNSNCNLNPTNEQIAVNTSSGEVVLASLQNSSCIYPGDTYDVAGGWVAYRKIGSSGERQLWTRDPSGNVAQVSPSGTNSELATGPQTGVPFADWSAINDLGEVIFLVPGYGRCSSQEPCQLYLGKAGTTPIHLTAWTTTAFVNAFWQNGDWFAVNGITLYRLDPYPDYERPVGASPLRMPLVPAFTPCGAPGSSPQNASHAAPLAGAACNPPVPDSSLVAVGPNSSGFARMIVLGSGQCAPFDPGHCYPDVTLRFDITDVRSGGPNGADYTTPSSQDLTALATLPDAAAGAGVQITDKRNQLADYPTSPFDKDGTTIPLKFPVPLACTGTADPTTGSGCDAQTTANTLVPGSVVSGSRAIWELGQLEVFDQGADGVAGNADDRQFETQGVFVP